MHILWQLKYFKRFTSNNVLMFIYHTAIHQMLPCNKVLTLITGGPSLQYCDWNTMTVYTLTSDQSAHVRHREAPPLWPTGSLARCCPWRHSAGSCPPVTHTQHHQLQVLSLVYTVWDTYNTENYEETKKDKDERNILIQSQIYAYVSVKRQEPVGEKGALHKLTYYYYYYYPSTETPVCQSRNTNYTVLRTPNVR